MCSDVVMKAQNLRKVYRLYPTPSSRLKQFVMGERRRYFQEFIALDGIDFELKQGEVLGVIGRNGAGKSTMLQLICGTVTPSSGELTVNGRIAALLELGAGFNPEFTGRENIYFAAAVIGLKRDEVHEIIEDIIDFSGIRPFIDQPVKTYSSGMFVRLAFSVATSVDPDILVIDEALSVGDGDFARRSFDRIMSMRDAGKTILFCSHSLYQVEVLCSRAIWLEAGKVVESGAPDKVVPNYQNFLDSLGKENPNDETAAEEDKYESINTDTHDIEEDPSVDSPSNTITEEQTSLPRITAVSVAADGIKGSEFVVQSEQSSLQIEVNFTSPVKDEVPGVAVVIHSASGNLVTSCASWCDGFSPTIRPGGYGHIRIDFDKIPLLKGLYNVGILLFCQRGIMLYDEIDPVAVLEVEQKGVERGYVAIPHLWNPEPTEVSANLRWLAVDARPEHENGLLELFLRAFEHPISIEEWRWKYRYSLSPGTVVFEDEEMVAFNGAMPRKGLVNGKETSIVHIGDSMVSPEARGILVRKGPFYLSVIHFYENYIGPNKRYSLSFGFPHARAARLGIKQGLYCEMDKVIKGSWELQDLVDSSNVSRLFTAQDAEIVDLLWRQMQEDLQYCVSGYRDFSWMKHRYLDKPNNEYLCHLVFDGIGQQCLGLVIIKPIDDQQVEILDILAPKIHVSKILEVARTEAKKLQAQTLFGWFTATALEWFAHTNPVKEDTDVIIAGSAVNDKEYSLSTTGQWWLMGGDTDFR